MFSTIAGTIITIPLISQIFLTITNENPILIKNGNICINEYQNEDYENFTQAIDEIDKTPIYFKNLHIDKIDNQPIIEIPKQQHSTPIELLTYLQKPENQVCFANLTNTIKNNENILTVEDKEKIYTTIDNYLKMHENKTQLKQIVNPTQTSEIINNLYLDSFNKLNETIPTK